MKYSVAAVLAAAAGASASYGYGHNNITAITEVVDVYTTYCPGPTEITLGTKTYTVTEETTLTITDCGCTVTRPITTSTEVVCHTCVAPPPSETPVVPPPAGTGEVTPTKPAPTTVHTAGAEKAIALSGAGFAGVLGLAAFIL